MKKLLCLLCAFMMMAAMACAESLDLSAMSTEELTQLRDAISRELAQRDAEARTGEYIAEFDGKNGFVGLTGTRREVRSSGDIILVLEFDYRNTTDEDQSVLGAIWPIVSVNGAQMQPTVFYNPSATSSLTIVQPGALVNQCEKYYLITDPDAPTFELVLYNGTDFRNPDKHYFELAMPD